MDNGNDLPTHILYLEISDKNITLPNSGLTRNKLQLVIKLTNHTEGTFSQNVTSSPLSIATNDSST